MTDKDIFEDAIPDYDELHVHPEFMGGVAVDEVIGEDKDFIMWEAELRIMKETNERESIANGKMLYLGRLSDIDGSGSWYGSISPAERIQQGDLTQERIDRAILPEYSDESNNLSRFFVEVVQHSEGGMHAKIRCIDGRCKLGYQSDSPEMYAEELGPQVAGGTFGQACAWRLAEGGTAAAFASADIERDTEYLVEAATRLGYESGGHVDDHSPIFEGFGAFKQLAEKQGINLEESSQEFLQASIDQLSSHGKTGCGAVDGIVDDLKRLVEPKDVPSIEALTKAILEQAGMYNQDYFDGVLAGAAKLQSAEGYFTKKASAIKKLVARKRNNLAVLSGSHNEAALNINFVDNTTFHTNEFSARNDNDIQVFNYDIWHTIQIAKELYPDNEMKSSRYIHARTALAVATSKRLMGDSVSLLFRLPHTA